jgi:formylglycine-generating enzyme required for sulfatase activity
MKQRAFRRTTTLCYLLLASLALVGWKCPGSPLVKPTFTGGPQSGHAPLFAQFQGDVTVLPPLVLAKFRGEPDDGDGPPPVQRQEPEPVTVISWLWNFGDGTSGSGQNTSHTYTDEGCHDVTLTVVLSNGMSGSFTRKDFICVEVGNRPPVANAGPDQEISVVLDLDKNRDNGNGQIGTLVQLDGSESFDPDGDPITYSWTFIEWPDGQINPDKPALSEPVLSDPEAESPTFAAVLPGVYVLQLVVDDGQSEGAKIASEPDTVTITATLDEPPVADAGPDQNACSCEEVQLDGSGSFDPEGLDVTYDWFVLSAPVGSNVSTTWLSDPADETPTLILDSAGEYVIWLIVTDPSGLSDLDAMTITATDPQTTMLGGGFENMTQGPSQTEIDAAVVQSNEMPPFFAPVPGYLVDQFEVTNCLYAFVLNYANGQGYLDAPEVKLFGGDNPEFDGEILLQIADIGLETEFCDIEYDAVHDIFFVARRDDQSMAAHPVVEVSWYGAVAFCNWLSEIESLDPVYDLSIWGFDGVGFDDGYRLGSEGEWEHAAAWESGDPDVHHIWGFVSSLLLTDINTNRVNYGNVNPLGLTNQPLTTPVGYFDGANGTTNSQSPVGCYDMSGNVWEWIFTQYYTYEDDKQVEPLERLVRSGSYADTANDVRSARREGLNADVTSSTVGFRVFQNGGSIGK